MPKSPISNAGIIKQSVKRNTKASILNTVTALDFSFSLSPTAVAHAYLFNLKDWCYIECDNKQPLARPLRLKRMKCLFKWVKRQRKDKFSDSTIYQKIRILKSYITFCDARYLDPFSKAGYLAYAGNDGELWRQVGLAQAPKQFLFQYCDGEGLGLKEDSAGNMKPVLDNMLRTLNFDVQIFQPTLQKFANNANNADLITKPYLPQEWQLALRRLNFYFTSLATQLITIHESKPNSPLPSKLMVQVDEVNGQSIEIICGSQRKGTGEVGYGNCSPFIQCMAAGYFLFSYYTAFNTSSILSIHHPIKPTDVESEGRTSKFIQIKAYKARSGNDILALFHSSYDENDHPEFNAGKAGFIIANVLKRESNGIQDGLTFINVMSLFSKTFSSNEYGPLFYDLDSQHKQKILNIGEVSRRLSENLGVFSSTRYQLVDHFVEMFNSVVSNKTEPRYRVVSSSDSGFKVMSKIEIKLTSPSIKRRAVPLAYAALASLTDIPLNGIIMPVRYSPQDENGNIDVSVQYENGAKNNFQIPAKYKTFLENLDMYSNTINPVSNPSKKGGISYRSAFLLPLGGIHKTVQWQSVESIIKVARLSQYGVSHGDFLLSFTASRIRMTTSHQEYREEDRGYGARMILQHTIEMQSRVYSNGHPIENRKMMSQSMQTLIKIAEGVPRDDAIDKVKSELNIPILSYEQYKERNMPTNPNGVSCDSKPDFVGSVKNLHYPARKFAKDNNIILPSGDIPCYQYDLCMFCKNAQIVDDPHAVYKLLSFIDAMSDAIDLFPERAGFINKKIERFKYHIGLLPLETLEVAQDLLFEQGRYFMFASSDAVFQYV